MGALVTKLTVDEFINLPERPGVKLERLDGELIEMSAGGSIHERVKANILLELAAFVKLRMPGVLVPAETTYHLNEEDSLMPDVSVLLSGNLDPDGTGRITTFPDIAVEVVSSESAERLQTKIEIYQRSGVRAIWVAYPALRVIHVYTKGSITRLACGQSLEEPDVLPGFTVPVDTLFHGV